MFLDCSKARQDSEVVHEFSLTINTYGLKRSVGKQYKVTGRLPVYPHLENRISPSPSM